MHPLFQLPIPYVPAFADKGRPYRILITGGEGYLGRQLLVLLLWLKAHSPEHRSLVIMATRRGIENASTSHSKAYPLPLFWEQALADPQNPNQSLWEQVQWIGLDVANDTPEHCIAQLELAPPDGVIHTVAAPKNAPLAQQLQVNVVGTECLLTALGHVASEARVVVCGSTAGYGTGQDANTFVPQTEDTPFRPVGAYGVSKAAQSMVLPTLAKRYGLYITDARLYNLYGAAPNTLSLASFASQIAQWLVTPPVPGEPLTLHAQNLRAERDYIHVIDVAVMLLRLLQHPSPPPVVHIASGQRYSLAALIERLLAVAASSPQGKDFAPAIVSQGLQQTDLSQSDTTMQQTVFGSALPSIGFDAGLVAELQYWCRALASDSLVMPSAMQLVR